MTANAVSATSCHEYIATNEIVYKDYVFAVIWWRISRQKCILWRV